MDKQDPTECRTFTIDEVAKQLGISRAAAYTLANNGGLPTIRLGRRFIVPKEALEKLLASAGAEKPQQAA